MQPRRLLVATFLCAAPLGAQATETAAPASPATPAAPVAAAHGRHIRMEYHAPSKWTIVELMPMALDPAGRRELRTSFRFPGHAPATTPATLTFAVVARGAGELYAKAPALALALDGGAPIPVTATRFARPASGGLTETTVYATMPRATLLRLTRATSAEVRIDDERWPVSAEMLAALRDLAGRMTPAGFRAAKSTQGTVAGLATDSAAPRTYLGGEVDTPVRPRGLLARPLFPVEAPRAKRRVWFRYAVDTTGLVDVETLRGESPVADSLFVASLRVAARRWLFTPARKEGRAVRMEVRQVLEFEPGT